MTRQRMWASSSVTLVTAWIDEARPRSRRHLAPAASLVEVADLAGDRIVAPRRGSAITTVLGQRFTDAGHPLHLALESGDPFLLRSLAARGFATAILPRSLTAPDRPAIEVRSLRPAVELPVALVWRGERNAPPAARAFIDFVRQETAVAR